jgi:putative ABC transport system ATP-binding protein
LVLLADEPTGNLDSSRSQEIMGLLTTLNQTRQITVIMVTHEPDMAAYADRVITFVDGQVIQAAEQSTLGSGGVGSVRRTPCG